MTDIVTGEAVALDLRLARLPSRSISFAIDAGIQLVGLIALLVGVGKLLTTGDEAARAAAYIIVVVLVFVAYPVAIETLWRGRTPGKAAMGLRVVRDDGGPIRFRHALVRGLFAVFLDLWPVFGLVAVISSLVSRRGKRVGDVVAGTIVVQERVAARAAEPPAMPPELAGWAATVDLSALPDDLALAARQFLARAPQLSPAPREQLGASLVRAIGQYIGPPPRGVPGWAYLSAVLAERRRRDEARLLGGRQDVGTAPTASPAPVPQAPPIGAPTTSVNPPDGFAPPA